MRARTTIASPETGRGRGATRPCCVLVRRPLDAVTSVVVMNRGPISDDACYRSYLHFNRGVLSLREGVVTCEFEEVTADPSVAVERLNERFGTSFACEPMSPELDERLLATLSAA